MKVVYKVVCENRSSVMMKYHSSPEFCLNYSKNTTVIADKKTLGIFCFKKRKDAEIFIRGVEKYYKILRVIPLDRGKTPKVISHVDYISSFYTCKFPITKLYIPKGTICYPSVLVLD